MDANRGLASSRYLDWAQDQGHHRISRDTCSCLIWISSHYRRCQFRSNMALGSSLDRSDASKHFPFVDLSIPQVAFCYSRLSF
jgi:hypothetical protein